MLIDGYIYAESQLISTDCKVSTSLFRLFFSQSVEDTNFSLRFETICVHLLYVLRSEW
jgi:hypothetical protein